jgi:hypothetical protein
MAAIFHPPADSRQQDLVTPRVEGRAQQAHLGGAKSLPDGLHPSAVPSR